MTTRTVGAVLLLSTAAAGQEAISVPAATMPSPGVFIPRVVTQLIGYSDPTTGESKTHGVQNASLAAGIAADWSVMLKFETSLNFDDRKSQHDPHLMFKHRFYRKDLGIISTERMAVYGGVEIDDNLDPFLGLVYTKIDGRWGTNLGISWETGEVANDGPPILAGHAGANLWKLQSSVLYRLFPEDYRTTSDHAWYATVETSLPYEENGDWEWTLGPGILYEGRRHAFEANLRLPVQQDINHRAETEWALAIGWRTLF